MMCAPNLVLTNPHAMRSRPIAHVTPVDSFEHARRHCYDFRSRMVQTGWHLLTRGSGLTVRQLSVLGPLQQQQPTTITTVIAAAT